MTQKDIDQLINMVNFVKTGKISKYIIQQKQRGIYWYLFDVDDRKPTRQITWTKNKNSAVQFVNEVDVIEVEEKYLHSYPTEIILFTGV